MQLSKNGISNKQVRLNRQKYGTNKIADRNRLKFIQLVASQITNPLLYILFFAVILNVSLGEYIEGAIILAVILINSSLSFFQEYKAINTLEILKGYLKTEVIVMRSGVEQVVVPEEVVVGDRVLFKPGAAIIADGVLVKAYGVEINEATLTGESVPVAKLKWEQTIDLDTSFGDEVQVFKGTTVTQGVGEYIVTAVGTNTRFGEIATLLEKEGEQLTPLQKKLRNLSEYISVFVVTLSIIFFLVGISMNEPIEEAFTLSIALAVSAIPEALIISLTVVLALGMNRLLKEEALVRKLVVAETLGSITTLCIDKTGTLTEGEMKVSTAKFIDQALAQEALVAANNKINTIDEAVLMWIQENNIAIDFSNNEFIRQIPFNSTNKYSLTIHEKKVYVVGATEQILEYCNLNAKEKDKINSEIKILATEGKRIIGIGYKKRSDGENITNLTWLGYLAFVDPVRTDVKQAVEQCKTAGITVKVITGDSVDTARSVMKEIGIFVDESEAISGTSLQSISNEVLATRMKTVKLFYRITPEQKYRIVKLLQYEGERVGMMGDGVNDAPALKRADVGVVVNNATDVSKDTADMILLNSSFNTLVSAVEEGRVIFENMKKVVTYLLADSFATVILVGGSFIFGLPLPLTALQILFINLVADSLPDLGLAFEPKEKDVMNSKISKHYGLLNAETISLIFIIGVVVNIGIFAVFDYFISRGYDLEEVRSFIFILLSLDSFLYVFSIRSLRKNIWQYPLLNNNVLNSGILGGSILILLAFGLPFMRDILELKFIHIEFIAAAVGLALTQIVLIEIIKSIFFKMYKQ